MAIVTSIPKGVQTSIVAATTTGTSAVFTFPKDATNNRVEVVGAGTLSSGTLILEENNTDPAYSGTWSQIQSVTASTLTGGASQVFHIVGTIGFLRARFSVNAGGGGTLAVNATGG